MKLSSICMFSLILSLTACVSSKRQEDNDWVKISNKEYQELQTSMQEWQQAKNGVERLLVIEQDLSLLIEQLSAHLNKQKATNGPVEVAVLDRPNTPIKEQVVAKATPINTIANPEPMPEQASKKQEGYALQVASVNELSRAKRLLVEIKTNGPSFTQDDNLTKLEPVVVKGKTYYRLKFGNFTSKEQANMACKQLTAKGFSCIVANNKGELAKNIL